MAPTCFGLRPSSESSRLSLAKVILILKHSVRLRRKLLCGGVAACPSMVCVLCAVQSETLLVNEQNIRMNGATIKIKNRPTCFGRSLRLSSGV